MKVTTRISKDKKTIRGTYGEFQVDVKVEKGRPLFDQHETVARKVLNVGGVDHRDVKPVEGDKVIDIPTKSETKGTYTWTWWGTWKDYKPGGGWREAWTSEGVFHG